LLEIARTLQSMPALGAATLAMARRSQPEGRLLAILDSSLDIRAEASGQHSVDYGVRPVKIGDLERSRNNFTEADSTVSRIKPGRNGLTYSFRQP
jgi:hypothetical protein